MIILTLLFGLLLVAGIYFVVATCFLNADGLAPSPDGEGWGEESKKQLWLLVGKCVAIATYILMSVCGPTAAVLFFAWPKKSIQKKRHPDAACFLRSSLLAGVAERGFLPLRQRDAYLHRPFGLFPPKAPVLGAAYGEYPSR